MLGDQDQGSFPPRGGRLGWGDAEGICERILEPLEADLNCFLATPTPRCARASPVKGGALGAFLRHLWWQKIFHGLTASLEQPRGQHGVRDRAGDLHRAHHLRHDGKGVVGQFACIVS